MAAPMKSRKLPRTDSIQELAKFWDSHDLTDFEDDLEEVKKAMFARSAPIKVQLQAAEAKAVAQLAIQRGVSREELIRARMLQRQTRQNGVRARHRRRGDNNDEGALTARHGLRRPVTRH